MIKKIHFIGIGGVSMSALAKLCIKNNIVVTGSDKNDSSEIQKLIQLGAKIFIGHTGKNIKKDLDLVVYTGAINLSNIEIIKSKKLGINLVERSEFLGLISSNYDDCIVIAGTHGKTTTTALIGLIFEKYNNATIHLGGNSLHFGNLKIGENKQFITEGCEYRNSIGCLHCDTHILTNIEEDHLDYYKSYENLENAFINYCNNAKKRVIVFEDCPIISKINVKKELIVVGFNSGNIIAKNIVLTKYFSTFDVYYNNEYVANFKTKLLGMYNVKNTLFAIATALVYNVPISIIYDQIKVNLGVERRQQIIATNVMVDYAHHPTEIKQCISELKRFYKKIYVIFQPHTYSRTKNLFSEFCTCFTGINKLAIYPTYEAREQFDYNGSAEYLFKNVKVNQNKKKYITNITEINTFIKKYSRSGLVLILGAGDLANKIII